MCKCNNTYLYMFESPWICHAKSNKYDPISKLCSVSGFDFRFPPKIPKIFGIVAPAFLGARCASAAFLARQSHNDPWDARKDAQCNHWMTEQLSWNGNRNAIHVQIKTESSKFESHIAAYDENIASILILPWWLFRANPWWSTSSG